MLRGLCGEGGGGLVGCVRGRGVGGRVPRVPGFILLVSFGGALLVVSILGSMVAIWGCFFGLQGVINGSCGGGRGGGDFAGCIQSRELGAYPMPSEVYPAGMFQ